MDTGRAICSLLSAARYPMTVRWILTIFASVMFAHTLDLPRTIRQGGTLRIHGPASAVTARMNDRTVRLFRQADGSSFGLMPVLLDQKPGAYTLDLLDQGGATVATASVQVVDAH